MEAKPSGKVWMRGYLALEAVLFFAIKGAELCGLPLQAAKCIKFSAILVDTLAACFLYRSYGRRALDPWHNLIALALLVNLFADVCLTLTGGETMFVPGFALFCTVQALYAVYLRPGRWNVAIRGALLLAAAAAVVMLDMVSLANLLGAWDLVLLAGNVVSAWTAHSREKSGASLLFAWGLSLFLCGDISVGLEIMTAPGTLLHTAAALLVWAVYAPAEVLLVLTYDRRVRTEEEAGMRGKEIGIRTLV